MISSARPLRSSALYKLLVPLSLAIAYCCASDVNRTNGELTANVSSASANKTDVEIRDGVECPHHKNDSERFAVAALEFSYVATHFVVGAWILAVSLIRIGK